METNFLALYRGETISGARIVALSADPQLVRDFADRLLDGPQEQHERPEGFVARDESARTLRVVRDKRKSPESGRGDMQ